MFDGTRRLRPQLLHRVDVDLRQLAFRQLGGGIKGANGDDLSICVQIEANRACSGAREYVDDLRANGVFAGIVHAIVG